MRKLLYDKTVRIINLSSFKKKYSIIKTEISLEQALIFAAPSAFDIKKYPSLLQAFKNLNQDLQYNLIESKQVIPPDISWSAPVFTGYKILKRFFGK